MTTTFEGDVPGFNQRFYENDPAAYLQRRLDQWLSAAESAGAFSAGRAKSSTHQATSDHSAVEPNELSFLITDAVLLHHHAAETVVRYYLAHVDEHPAPWTEIAGQRRDFNKLVRARLTRPSPPSSEVASVVYGSAARPVADADEWENAVEGATDFLRSMADTYLGGAPMYNSLKHGLGAVSGRTDVVFTETLAESSHPTVAEIQAGHRMGDGPRVEYPTYARADDGNVWSINTEWVDVERSIRLIMFAIGLLQNIRTVGRRRRGAVDDPGSGSVPLFTPGPYRAENMASPDRSAGHRLSQPWLRETKNSSIEVSARESVERE